MINFISYNNILKSLVGIAVLAVLGSWVNVSAASATLVPSCTITAYEGYAQGVLLKWDSTDGALFASIDNGIGNIAPDGQMFVAPAVSTVYTMHTWNTQGEGGYCSTTVAGGAYSVNQPNVTLQTVAIHPSSTSVTLGNVPYTGATDSLVYTLFLVSLLLTAGYAFTVYRKTALNG